MTKTNNFSNFFWNESPAPKKRKRKSSDSNQTKPPKKNNIQYGDYYYKTIKKSPNPTKKYDAIFTHVKTGKEKKVSFGSINEKDYTQLKDRKYKEYYLEKHKLKDNNLMSAQALNQYVLWNKNNIGDSIESYKRMLKKEQKNKTKQIN